jgi:hypothetical protein
MSLIKTNASFKHFMKRRKERGASLMEIMMYMGLAAFIMILVIQWYNQANESSKVSATVQNLNSLTVGVRDMFATQGTYEGITNNVVTSSNVFPEQMRVPTDENLIKNAWQTDGVDIIAANVEGSDSDGFELTFKGVPKRACNDFLDKTYRYYKEVEANGSDVTSGIAAIRTGCSDEESNVIIFRTR